jgi:CMP-N,N'-diacetyllegionaminic acid synthase
METTDKNPKIVAIIPARGGSKGIPHKNIKPLNDRPLIHYAIELAKEAQKKGVIFDHIVSTDSEEIASIAKEMEGNVPFLRPAELATDGSAVVDTAIHAVNWWEKNHADTIHSILILQPTNPLTAGEDIENSVKHYLDNQPDASCLVSVCDAQHIRLSSLYHEKG